MTKLGVDLVDVSTGGNWEKQKIPVGPGSQVSRPRTPFPFKESINFLPPPPTLRYSLRFLSLLALNTTTPTFSSAPSVSSPTRTKQTRTSKTAKPTLFSSRGSSSARRIGPCGRRMSSGWLLRWRISMTGRGATCWLSRGKTRDVHTRGRLYLYLYLGRNVHSRP